MTSRFYQSTWSYDPNGDDFNARVGRILSRNMDLKTSMRRSALAELKGQLEFEKEQVKPEAGASKAAKAAQLNQPGMSGPVVPLNTQGLVWVDSTGRVAATVEAPKTSRTGSREQSAEGTTRYSSSTSRPSTAPVLGASLSHSQALYSTMDTTQRSMHMWRRVNAGCMEYNTKTPISTFKDHFQYDKDAARPVLKHHLKKNPFSEYTEVKLKLMHHLKGV